MGGCGGRRLSGQSVAPAAAHGLGARYRRNLHRDGGQLLGLTESTEATWGQTVRLEPRGAWALSPSQRPSDSGRAPEPLGGREEGCKCPQDMILLPACPPFPVVCSTAPVLCQLSWSCGCPLQGSEGFTAPHGLPMECPRSHPLDSTCWHPCCPSSSQSGFPQ